MDRKVRVWLEAGYRAASKRSTSSIHASILPLASKPIRPDQQRKTSAAGMASFTISNNAATSMSPRNATGRAIAGELSARSG
jgi:hypothetical protein